MGTWSKFLAMCSRWSRCLCCVLIGNGKTERKWLGLVGSFSGVGFDRWRIAKLAAMATEARYRRVYNELVIFVVNYLVSFCLAGLTR